MTFTTYTPAGHRVANPGTTVPTVCGRCAFEPADTPAAPWRCELCGAPNGTTRPVWHPSYGTTRPVPVAVAVARHDWCEFCGGQAVGYVTVHDCDLRACDTCGERESR